MRRLWAYILLAFTSLVLVGVSFSPLMKNANSNMDYQAGKELIFHIESKDENKELSKAQLEEVASTMSDRLAKQGVTRYEINIQGRETKVDNETFESYDTISIILSQDYDQQYTSILQFMEFDGSFALTNSAGVYALASEFLVEGGQASLEEYNGYPCITLPVNVEGEKYKEVLEGAKGEGAKPETSGEGEDEVSTYYLYLWYGFEEKFINAETNYTSDSHIIMKFRVSDKDKDAEDYDQYFPNTTDKLFSVLNLDSDGDGVASYNEKKVAYDTANFYVNLLNASKLEVTDGNGKMDVTVKYMGSNYVAPLVESPINYGDISSIAMSPTMIATLASILLISLVLVYFFRLGALASITTTIVSLFAGLAAMVLLTAEFTAMSVAAFVAVAIASVSSGIVYLSKIKDEAYRGRTLKKACLDGGKKAILPVVDINVVLMILGVFAYILGGSAMRTFAAITVLGGLASLILNTLGLKLMLWLAFNATALQGKYQFFGIDGSKVPNTANEEKQTYFGPYADKDLTKQKTKMGIAGGVLLVASIVAMIVFGAVSGSIYNEKNPSYNDRIYLQTTMEESSQINDSSIKDILNKTYVYYDTNGNNVCDENEKTSAKKLETFGVEKIDTGKKSYVITDEMDNDKTYYLSIVYLKGQVDPSYKAYYDVNGDGTLLISDTGDRVNDVNSIVNYAIEHNGILENAANVSLKTIKGYEVGQPSILHIAISALVGAAVSGLYLILRYRLSRGLASTLLAIATGTVGLGLLSLVHVSVLGGYTAVMALLAVLFAYILSIIFMNKEREMVLEDKSRDASLENRKRISIKALSASYVAMFYTACAAFILGLVFFGIGSKAFSLNYASFLVVTGLTLIILPVVIAPVSNLFGRLFSSVKITKKSTKKDKKKKVTHKTGKSAEPEEAIFIGIND